MEVKDTSRFFRMRQNANQRARDLIAFLKEKCEPNDAIPENIRPEALHDQIAEVFFESEKIENDIRQRHISNS